MSGVSETGSRARRPGLIVVRGERRGQTIFVDHVLLVGRLARCGVVLDDPGVSRVHARLLPTGGEVFVEDLGSRAGTLLNRRRLERATPLQDGDELVVGPGTFVFAADATSPDHDL
jgi:pSer/pThr/pTyr-binding forkhead associated (FHA) protein